MKHLCRKKSYDWLGAQIALAEMARKAKRNSQQAQLREEHRAYRCPECGSWHVTSEPKRARETHAKGIAA